MATIGRPDGTGRWSMDRHTMIVAKHLTKQYGRLAAVDDVNFAVSRGQVVGFLGPNGAGKSTTIRMMAGYLTPTAGHVEIDGLDVQRKSRAVRQHIGYLPESAPLYTEMRVNEFLTFRAKLFSVARGKRRAAIDLAVRRCGLEEVRRRPIHQLSKGYRQRVGFAAAILHEPPVLILDEPSSGLDPTQIREMRRLIRELAAHHTIVLSSHILPEVELTCDHIIMIARGRIRAQGTIESLKANAAPISRYQIETRTSGATGVIQQIRGVKDVQTVSLTDGWVRLSVSAAPDAGDLREPMSSALSRQNIAVRELSREAPSLEQLFVKMIADAEAEVESSSAIHTRAGDKR